MSDQWFCFVNDDTVGPISTASIVGMIQSGELNVKVKVASPERTQNGWVLITTIPEFSVVFAEIAAARNQQKEQAQAAKRLAAEQAQAAKETRQRERHLAADEKRKRALRRDQERQVAALPDTVAVTTREAAPQVSASRRISRHSRRSTTPTSIIDFFDWKFEKYLTPWIVRATWVIALFTSALWALVMALAFLGGTAVSDDTSDDTRRTSARRLSTSTPIPISLGGNRAAQAVRTVAFVTLFIGVIVGLLWTRVVLELAIVAFNIANSLVSIDDKLS
jgi:hypothetical protein